MGYSSTQKTFSGSGKIHNKNGPEIMFEFRRSDYNRIVQRLENMASRMTIRKAINRAAKRAAGLGVTLTTRGIAADTTLKSSEVREKVKPYAYGSPLDMVIGMKISDTARPLSDFAFIPKKPKYKTAPTVEIYKGRKEKLSGQRFVAQMPNQHIGIFERESEKRKNRDVKGMVIGTRDVKGMVIGASKEHIHIHQLPGPSVTGLFKANENVHKHVWNMIMAKFEERIEHELKILLEG